MEKQLVTYIARFTWAFMWNQYCINVYCSISFQCKSTQKNEPKMKWVSFKTNSGRSVTKDGRWHFLLATIGMTTCYFHRKHTKKNSKTSKLIQFFAYWSHIPPQFLNLVTTLLWCCISVGVKQKTAKNHQEVSFFNFTNWTEYHLFYHILLFIAFLSIFNCS